MPNSRGGRNDSSKRPLFLARMQNSPIYVHERVGGGGGDLERRCGPRSFTPSPHLSQPKPGRYPEQRFVTFAVEGREALS